MTVLRGAGPVEDPVDRGSSGAEVAAGTAGETGTQAGAYDTRWLDLRAGADDRARSADLLRRLLAEVATMDRRGLHLLDLGCGAGAMRRWCAERLPGPARWTLLDPDPALLAVAMARDGGSAAVGAVATVDAVGAVATVDAVGAVATVGRVGAVTDLDADLLADVDAVVCSALLDVLSTDDLRRLVDVLGEARLPLLAALTVTGEVRLSPGHPEDTRAARAVHATATGDGAAGPAALDVVRTAAGRRGSTVVARRTPWLLDPAHDGDLLRAWAEGYVAAALAHDGDLDRWAHQRLALVARAGLAVAVEHVDVLVLPA